jgi:hypothetical protein
MNGGCITGGTNTFGFAMGMTMAVGAVGAADGESADEGWV